MPVPRQSIAWAYQFSSPWAKPFPVHAAMNWAAMPGSHWSRAKDPFVFRAPTWSSSNRTPERSYHPILVQNLIFIALLGQESMPVGCEGLVHRFAGHDGVEMGHGTVAPGAQNSPEALGFLLAAGEGTGNFYGNAGIL